MVSQNNLLNAGMGSHNHMHDKNSIESRAGAIFMLYYIVHVLRFPYIIECHCRMSGLGVTIGCHMY